MTLDDDGGSYDELAARAGVELRLPRVGEAGLDLERMAALYWPLVPAELEPRPRRLISAPSVL